MNAISVHRRALQAARRRWIRAAARLLVASLVALAGATVVVVSPALWLERAWGGWGVAPGVVLGLLAALSLWRWTPADRVLTRWEHEATMARNDFDAHAAAVRTLRQLGAR